MIRRKSPARKYSYGRKPEPPPKAEDTSTLMEKVKRLPMPGPDVRVIIPLHLWTAYRDLYGLVEHSYKYETLYFIRTKKEGLSK